MKKTKATFLAGCATLAIATLSGSTAQAQFVIGEQFTSPSTMGITARWMILPSYPEIDIRLLPVCQLAKIFKKRCK